MDREQAKEYIKAADWQPVLSLMAQAQDKKTYQCPFCGKGKNGDGLHMNPKTHKLHCYGQDCQKEYDQIDIIGRLYNLTGKAAFDKAFQIYGLQIDDTGRRSDGNHKTPAADQMNTQTQTAITDTFIADIARQDIAKAQENCNSPAFIDYLTARNLTPETAARYGLGFLSGWTPPKNRIDGKRQYPDDRIIIPTGDHAYTARRIDGKKEYRYINVGTQGIFNVSALTQKERPVFVVEGALDALSIIEAGGEAISLNSTNNASTLLAALKDYQQKGIEITPLPIILALDNDQTTKAGQKAQKELVTGLDNLKIRYTDLNTADFYGQFFIEDADNPDGKRPCKDANEVLQVDKTGLSKAIQAAENADEEQRKADIEALKRESAGAYLDELQKEFTEALPPITTGFPALDNILCGGLRSGMYFLGGVSSAGKTAFAMQLCDQYAKAGGDTLVFACEMPLSDLVARSISRESTGDPRNLLTQNNIQDGFAYCTLNDWHKENMKQSFNRYRQYADRITIYDNRQGDLSAEVIKAKIERYCTITGRRPLVIVDYLQIVKPNQNRRGDDIRGTIDDTIRSLNAVKIKYGLPIVVISALNRENYVGPLTFAAFRDTSAIEYSADYVFGLQFRIIHDKDFQKPSKSAIPALLDRQEREKHGKLKTVQGITAYYREVEISILKQRRGKPRGTVAFDYDAAHNNYIELGEITPPPITMQCDPDPDDDEPKEKSIFGGHKYSRSDIQPGR